MTLPIATRNERMRWPIRRFGGEPRRARAWTIFGVFALVGFPGIGRSTDTGPEVVPAWLFPLNPPATTAAQSEADGVRPLHVHGSSVTFTQSQLNDLFAAPDWHPKSHSVMPPVVAHGRPPDVYACGYCHTPGGQGRPENAALAGLPATYIIQQLADFKSGLRRSTWPGAYRPADRMIHAAMNVSAEETEAAAQYFSRQRLGPRVHVVERSRVPRSHVVGWVYVADPGGTDEPLGERLLEFAPDPTRQQNLDDEMRYIAYVPKGSIKRGRSVARFGAEGLGAPCVSCHGEKFRGGISGPPIAGRSPTYVLRQLLAFKTGARSGPTSLPMQNVVAGLKMRNMIDVTAYAASLVP